MSGSELVDQVIDLPDPRIAWRGVAEVETGAGWQRGWRLPLSRIALFPGEKLRSRAVMQAGVRVAFRTDSRMIGGRLIYTTRPEVARVDLTVAGALVASVEVSADGDFAFTDLPAGPRDVELWLPLSGDVRLARLLVGQDATVQAAEQDRRPRLIAYGSSITQCRHAFSPTRSWPAVVAEGLGMNLTNVGLGGECHLDPMIARYIRDRPADLIMACVGVNIHSWGTFNERSLVPAILGFLSTVRDGHPEVPVLLMSPVVSPVWEDQLGRGGMTLAQVRELVAEAFTILAADDPHLHFLDGLSVFGPQEATLLVDAHHPGAEGYEVMGRRIHRHLRDLLRDGNYQCLAG